MSKLSPISNLNFNPTTQKVFLKDAASKVKIGEEDKDQNSESFPIIAMKTAKSGQIDRKARAEEASMLAAAGKDGIDNAESVRLSNY